ncbi:MAG: RHS repeat-associated core domain-containing protein, partial [Chloroflexota bacterium]
QVTGQPAITLSYSDIGNILSKSDIGSYSYGLNAGPHAVTAAGNRTFEYDANGSRTETWEGGIATETVSYSSFNKPVSISKNGFTVTFTYGPDYARYKQTIDGSTTIYVGGMYERVTDADSIQDVHTISSPSGPIATFVVETDTNTNFQVESLNYLHADHLGSIEFLTDTDGEIVEHLSYDAWGKRRNSDWSASANDLASEYRYGFTGHEMLDEIGLIHMNGRVYDPEIGRFLSADPFVQAPHYSQNYNRYTYVLNNPLSIIDPSGYFFSKIFDAIGDAIGGVVDFIEDNAVAIIAVAAGVLTAGAALWALGPALALGGAATSFASAGGVFGALFGGGLTFAGAVAAGAGFGFGSAFAGTIAAGGSLGDALSAGLVSGVMGGISGGAFHAVGSAYKTYSLTKVVAHGAVGGTMEVVRGGKFEHGFFSTAFTSMLNPAIDGIKGFSGDSFARIAISAAIGGTAAEIGGGKFANGAISAGFMRAFNEEASHTRSFREEVSEFAKGSGSLFRGLYRFAKWRLAAAGLFGENAKFDAIIALNQFEQALTIAANNRDLTGRILKEYVIANPSRVGGRVITNTALSRGISGVTRIPSMAVSIPVGGAAMMGDAMHHLQLHHQGQMRIRTHDLNGIIGAAVQGSE